MNEEQVTANREEFVSEREMKKQEIERAFNPNLMKVVRKELFANLRDPAVTIRDGNITFNTACINGLEDVVYVTLMIDEKQGFISVTGCDENDKGAIRWCVAKPDKRKSRKMRCPDFTDGIYELLGWDKKCRYKILGYKIVFEDKVYYVFDLKVHQIFKEKPKKGEEPVYEENESVAGDARKGYFPDDIANTFGVPMEQYRKETAITDMDGFVTMAMFTGAGQEES